MFIDVPGDHVWVSLIKGQTFIRLKKHSKSLCNPWRNELKNSYSDYCHQENSKYLERQINPIHWPSHTPKDPRPSRHAYTSRSVAPPYTVVQTQSLPSTCQWTVKTVWLVYMRNGVLVFCLKKNEIMPFTGKGSELGVYPVKWKKLDLEREGPQVFSFVEFRFKWTERRGEQTGLFK